MPPRTFTFVAACLYSGLAVVGLGLAFLAHKGSAGPASLAVGILPLSPAYNLVHLVIGLVALLACRRLRTLQAFRFMHSSVVFWLSWDWLLSFPTPETAMLR